MRGERDITGKFLPKKGGEWHCNRCGRTPEETPFGLHKRSASGLSYQCRECCSMAVKASARKLREETLAALGGACVCCGESIYEFLGIDHIGHGRGNPRPLLETGQRAYRKARADNYDPAKWRLLCHNCNLATGFYGLCPHQLGSE